MSLVNYLSKYFPTGSTGTFEAETVSIVPHFLEKFGVDVKIENDLYLFKYDQITVKWSYELTKECRGIILRNTDGKWEVVSRALNKFWNLHEGHSPIFNVKEFNDNINNLKIATKEDGTCIVLWYDFVRNAWRASTLGMITPGVANDSFYTFDKLFEKVIGKPLTDLKLDTSKTYIWELCAYDNRVVTKYASDRVYLIGVRDTKYGIPSSDWEMDEIVIYLTEAGFSNIYRPVFMDASSVCKDQDSFKIWVEETAVDTAEREFPEGYVLYLGGTPVAKAKNMRYLHLHSFSSGDFKHTKNQIIEAIFMETLDDYYFALTDPAKEFADKVKDKIRAMKVEVYAAVDLLKGLIFENQKDYALWVQKNSPKMFTSFFFANKEDLLDGVGTDLFSKWMKLNYKKFVDNFKES
jgi:hypothetical protein